MYREINKLVAGACIVFCLTACGNSEQKAAEELYAQSEQAITEKNYPQALALLDTLNARYPKQTEVRRNSLRLRASAMEGIAMDSIGALENELAAATIAVDEWRPRFRHVDSSVGLEGYFLPIGVDEKVMTTSGIQARVSDKGFFYIVANVQGKAIGLKSIEIVDGAESVSSAEISPSRVISVEGSESASFNPEDLEALGRWLPSHRNASGLILIGSKSSVKLKLSSKQMTELVDCYEYSRALQAQRLASVRREKFERMLATARDQLANLPQKDSGE